LEHAHAAAFIYSCLPNESKQQQQQQQQQQQEQGERGREKQH
jgi:hypothetical protein